jgi:hypothetical protein
MIFHEIPQLLKIFKTKKKNASYLFANKYAAINFATNNYGNRRKLLA